MQGNFFSEEEEQNIGKKQWEDFLQMQDGQRQQPQQHEDNKNVCLKIFPKLASKTNLDEEELQTYFAIRFQYLSGYDEKNKAHEESLCRLAQSLMKGGKIQYEIREATSDSGSSMEECKQKVVIQFSHDDEEITLD